MQKPTLRRLQLAALLTCSLVTFAAPAAESVRERWWSPGQADPLPELAKYDNDFGDVGILNQSGRIETKGHPFFEPIGTNGRACVTCHQPADGMSVSLRSIRERWAATGGKDPIFAAIDGQNCPNLPNADPASHSLLLERGLFRVSLPWPPRRPDGSVIDPEFTLEVVRDPSGCNLSAEYGLKSADPRVSVFRRPRVAANTKYTTHQNFGVGMFIGKNGMPSQRDPATGKPTSMNLMSDARAPSLVEQAKDAAFNHLQVKGGLTDEQIDRIVQFERQVYSAQITGPAGADLAPPDGPSALGPRNVAKADAGVLGNNTTRWVFPLDGKWKQIARTGNAQEDARSAARESIARGQDVFMFRTFWIKDSMHLNTVGLGNPTKRTCATCHGMHMMGLDSANGWMDIGTTNLPWATEVPLNPWNEAKPQMPLFRVTCKADVRPHPFLGRVIYTQDPGRALVSGLCNDVGTIVMQQFRGLAARAPYFSNGSAQTLRELVDYYDRRYNIGYSAQEKQDLVNFLGAL